MVKSRGWLVVAVVALPRPVHPACMHARAQTIVATVSPAVQLTLRTYGTVRQRLGIAYRLYKLSCSIVLIVRVNTRTQA